MNVRWTENALADLSAIHAYVSQYSETYADSLIKRITNRLLQISAFPLAGTKLGNFGLGQIREIHEQKYRIVYYVTPDQIEVLGVIHSARNTLRDSN